jgi:hypothetical protein
MNVTKPLLSPTTPFIVRTLVAMLRSHPTHEQVQDCILLLPLDDQHCHVYTVWMRQVSSCCFVFVFLERTTTADSTSHFGIGPPVVCRRGWDTGRLARTTTISTQDAQTTLWSSSLHDCRLSSCVALVLLFIDMNYDTQLITPNERAFVLFWSAKAAATLAQTPIHHRWTTKPEE